MTESDTTYNGWKNYETWAVGMYLDGNYTGQATYADALETVAAAIADHPRSEHWTEEQATRFAVADALHMYVEESSGFPETGLAGDLLNAAISSVDWYELADAWIQNVSEQVS